MARAQSRRDVGVVELAGGDALGERACDDAVDDPRQVPGDGDLQRARARDRDVAARPAAPRMPARSSPRPARAAPRSRSPRAAGRPRACESWIGVRTNAGCTQVTRHVRAVLGAQRVGVGDERALRHAVGGAERQAEEGHAASRAAPRARGSRRGGRSPRRSRARRRAG